MKMRSVVGLALLFCGVAYAQDLAPVVHVPNAPNAAATYAKHYVVMVSLDGFRYDYARVHGAPHLDAMAREGAWTPGGMLPSYPSITFPNHYALVTGLRPEHSGIVGMDFWSEARGEAYYYGGPAGRDGSWYRGVPLWVLAEKQGMRSASFFWPGSDAEIDGVRPSYYVPFDDKFDDHKRIAQVVQWLQLPEAERPHFITLYYSDTDHSGHNFGPLSVETHVAVHKVDDLIGELREKLKATGLPIDLIVTADHGMIALNPEPVLLDKLVDLTAVKTSGTLIYAKDDAEARRLFTELRAVANGRFDVYRRKDVPRGLHFNENVLEGDPVVIARAPYDVRPHASTHKPYAGSHGFDPHATPEMKAIFYVEGPDVKPGAKIASFDNVDVYSLVARLLGLKAGKTDGELGPLKVVLR